MSRIGENTNKVRNEKRRVYLLIILAMLAAVVRAITMPDDKRGPPPNESTSNSTVTIVIDCGSETDRQATNQSRAAVDSSELSPVAARQ